MTRNLTSKAAHSKAQFSPCRKYRYTLERVFQPSLALDHAGNKGMMLFLMLNPSTADEQHNDPTVAKCERLALQLGYSSMAVANLFAYRATDPADMLRAARYGENIVGTDNDAAIEDLARRAAMIVCAWGNDGAIAARSRGVVAMLAAHRAKLHYLELNNSGEPKHPLYVAARHLPKPWELPA